MAWVETESLSFTARYEGEDEGCAQRTLDRLEDLRLRLEERFDHAPGGITVVVHPLPGWLAAAHPFLPGGRAAAPAGRRYLAGWAMARRRRLGATAGRPGARAARGDRDHRRRAARSPRRARGARHLDPGGGPLLGVPRGRPPGRADGAHRRHRGPGRRRGRDRLGRRSARLRSRRLADVGGDAIAAGDEPGLGSPLCDAVMLAAGRRLADRVDGVLAVLGAGCDGELELGEVLGRVAALAAVGAWIGTSSVLCLAGAAAL